MRTVLLFTFITCSLAVGLYDFSTSTFGSTCINRPLLGDPGSYKFLGEPVTSYVVSVNGYLSFGGSCTRSPYLYAYYGTGSYIGLLHSSTFNFPFVNFIDSNTCFPFTLWSVRRKFSR